MTDEIEEVKLIEDLIRKLCEIYKNHKLKYSDHILHANMLAKLKNCQLNDNETSLKDVWLGVIEKTKVDIKTMLELIKVMPGINEINSKDLKIIIEHHCADYNSVYYLILIFFKILKLFMFL